MKIQDVYWSLANIYVQDICWIIYVAYALNFTLNIYAVNVNTSLVDLSGYFNIASGQSFVAMQPMYLLCENNWN